MKIDETTILRFVDGDLSEQEFTTFEKILEADESLQLKVKKMQLSDLPYRAAFAEEAIPPVPAALIETLEQAKFAPEVDERSSRRLFSVKVASLCAMFFVAGFFIKGGSDLWPQLAAQQSELSSPLADAMIQYQALYTRDTVRPVSQSAEAAAALIEQFNTTYASTATIPNLEAEGYRFRRVQQLAFEDQPILQIVYMGETGEPIALCLTLSDQTHTPKAYVYAGMNSYLWEKEGLGYMLMAKLPFSALDQLLNSIEAV